jgi:hypothetical protein
MLPDNRHARHLQCISEKGRLGWQKASGYNKRSRVEAAIGRYKQVIGEWLRSRKDTRRSTEVGVAVNVLSRIRNWDARSPSASHEFRWGRGCDESSHAIAVAKCYDAP